MKKSRNQKVDLELLQNNRISLTIKREDELHPFISGNKFRKLKYNLEEAKRLGCKTLLSFGGAYSNHISALSYAGKLHGFKTLGVIRGEELADDLAYTLTTNPTLKFAAQNGMEFKFISRTDYRNKGDQQLRDKLKHEFGEFYEIPEGGTNELAVKGCEEILEAAEEQYDVICVSVGTGGTISGLINSVHNGQKVIGFPSLKTDYLDEFIQGIVGHHKGWELNNDYHFGGYAKVDENLISFINDFNRQTTIPLDPIYTGKMMFGIIDLVQKDFFRKNTRILAVHTGGLQGIEGMNQRLLKKKLPLINV